MQSAMFFSSRGECIADVLSDLLSINGQWPELIVRRCQRISLDHNADLDAANALGLDLPQRGSCQRTGPSRDRRAGQGAVRTVCRYPCRRDRTAYHPPSCGLMGCGRAQIIIAPAVMMISHSSVPRDPSRRRSHSRVRWTSPCVTPQGWHPARFRQTSNISIQMASPIPGGLFP